MGSVLLPVADSVVLGGRVKRSAPCSFWEDAFVPGTYLLETNDDEVAVHNESRGLTHHLGNIVC